MNLLGILLTTISLLPFWVLHRFSDLTYFGIYHVMGYRKKVVWQNLKNSFPEKSDQELRWIQKKFYQNFCDLIFETIKTFSISEKEIDERCVLENPEVAQNLWRTGANVAGISSHMGNWEWLSLSMSLATKHEFLAVYKPLANRKLNDLVISSRQRFGAKFTAIKNLKAVLDQPHDKPYLVGLLSDQAPHDYAKAFELPFLNQSTFFVPGAGILSVQKNLTPLYGWIKRVGRSRYVWRLELLNEDIPSTDSLTAMELGQVRKISVAHGLSELEAVRALVITRKFVRQLESEIKMAPQDWLWSHRRWKNR
jgi:KDO2-lipid IV(A) lauroyltransferase